tara:strand:- start:138 stop:566 length:429 start_codon:yes stop_codon:yes gene_type:complete
MDKYKNSMLTGMIATTVLLLLYGAVLSLVSGFSFMTTQWAQFWPYVVTLAVGFGIQAGLYVRLREKVKEHAAGKVAAVSGTTSTLAMMSCCTHYLVNILPMLGATGVVVFVAQYQIELFWFGIVANLAGMSYMLYKLKQIPV